MEEGRFPVHKWESNVLSLESADMPNPGKILGLTWHKQDDVLEIQVPEKKIAEITEEIGIQWKYVPSEKNVADAGSRGATLNQMDWFDGPEWLLNEHDWPSQPALQRSSSVTDEAKPIKEIVAFFNENQQDEWDLFAKA
jgi:hypothetical protein